MRPAHPGFWGGTASLCLVLAGLYTSQGIAHGFFNRTFPVLLREAGVSVEAIGLAHLLFLPWVLNILWSPLVDRWHLPGLGRRKSWIIPCQWLLAAALVGVGFWVGANGGMSETALYVLAALAIFASAMAATQDTATDGYAVDALPPDRHGWGNGIQIGAYWIGLLIGGAGILALQAKFGLVSALGVVSLFILATSLLVAIRPEPARLSTQDAARPSLLRALARPEMRLMLLFILLYRIGDGFGGAMMLPYFVDLGLSAGDIAWLLAAGGIPAAIAGSACAAVSLKAIGKRRAILWFGAAQVVVLALLWAIVAARTTSLPLILITVALQFFVVSLVFVALYAASMELCDPRQSSTDFTLQAAMGNLVSIAGSAVSGYSVAAFGYSGHFLLALLLAALGLASAVLVLRAIPIGETRSAEPAVQAMTDRPALT